MQYELTQTAIGWQIERIHFDLEGQIEVTLFTGYEAEARARRYLFWMNTHARLPEVPR